MMHDDSEDSITEVFPLLTPPLATATSFRAPPASAEGTATTLASFRSPPASAETTATTLFQSPPGTSASFLTPPGAALATATDQTTATSSRSQAKGNLSRNPNGRSYPWDHFQIYLPDRFVVNCNHCKKDLCYNGNTTALTRHLSSMHKPIADEWNRRQLLNASKSKGVTSWLVDNSTDKVHDTLIRFIVDKYLPYDIVNADSFRNFVSALNQKTPVISSKKVKQLIAEKVAESKSVVIEKLKGTRGAMTTDGWTSRQNCSYFGFTFHYINEDWELINIPLGIEHHVGQTTAPDHLVDLSLQLDRYGLKWSNLVAVVTDTAAVMNAFGRLIEGSASVPHIGCVDHVLNTITKTCALDPKNLPQPAQQETGALKIARSLVATFNHSSQLTEELLKLQRDRLEPAVKLIQDVPTRWWSTYAMVLRLLRLKVHINAMAPHSDKFVDLNHEQWTLLEGIRVLL